MENPMLKLGQSSARKEIVTRIEEITSLDAIVCRDAQIERQNILQFATDTASDHFPSPHAVYCHDHQSAHKVFGVFEEIRQGKTISCDTASLRSLHYHIFSPSENAGVLSSQDNGVRTCNQEGIERLLYQSAPAHEKGSELDWAFDVYRQAKAKDPQLALAYAVCLTNLLVNIHPFEDGNGRTSRIMLVSNLKAAGLKHATDIPFEQCHVKYRRLVCCALRKADKGKYSRSIGFWPYVRVMLDLVILGYKKLPKQTY